MSNQMSRSSLVLAALLLALASGGAPAADAATARVRWMPGGGSVSRYDVYVRAAGTPHDEAPAWSGNPAPGADGSLSAFVSFTPADSGVSYFAVVAVDEDRESALSQELPTGTPDPCQTDTCTTKTSCTFGTAADGTPCDDGAFCNGAETCRAGVCRSDASRDCSDGSSCTVDRCDEEADVCTHVGSPGCCAACDGGDPCQEAACLSGDCSAGPGTALAIGRLRLVVGASDVRLSFNGKFERDGEIDAAGTGVILEVRSSDGTVLHTSSLGGGFLRGNDSGKHYHFAAGRQETMPGWNGLERLDLRRNGGTWQVSGVVKTPDLADAVLEPAVTLVVRLGATCTYVDAPCEQKSRASICS